VGKAVPKEVRDHSQYKRPHFRLGILIMCFGIADGAFETSKEQSFVVNDFSVQVIYTSRSLYFSTLSEFNLRVVVAADIESRNIEGIENILEIIVGQIPTAQDQINIREKGFDLGTIDLFDNAVAEGEDFHKISKPEQLELLCQL
jgi:hypothetical protein